MIVFIESSVSSKRSSFVLAEIVFRIISFSSQFEVIWIINLPSRTEAPVIMFTACELRE